MKTIFEKIWDKHLIYSDGSRDLIYIDLHLIHEVTSPQAFDGLRIAKRRVRRPDLTFATVDHNIPTDEKRKMDEISAKQVRYLENNCKEFGIKLFGMDSPYQGIVHVIGPELGLTQPGKTVVCGDSHTATHGALGSLAFGIGTSEVEHVLATQCLWLSKPQKMKVEFVGNLQKGVTAKDIILGFIGKIGTDGTTGYVIEFRGNVIKDLSIEERMTICNMSVECGARTAIIEPDEKTVEYLKGKVENFALYKTDEGAKYDKELIEDVSSLEPQVTWGVKPSQVVSVTDRVPNPDEFSDEVERSLAKSALEYMGLKPGTKITDIRVDRVFIGSCTNGRLSDLVSAANIVKGKKVADDVRALVVPGSQLVKREAEKLGIDKIFIEAGFEWRNPGCSMCLGMNADILLPGERSASTSNRNFEGRQGRGGRTHLVSPIMAAAAAIKGHFVDVREMI